MKRSTLWLLLGVFAAGYPCGSLGWSLTHPSSEAASLPVPPPAARPSQRSTSEAVAVRPAHSAAPVDLHSAETIDSLLDVNDPTLFGRLALWLVDASETDIAAYWQAYHKITEEPSDTIDLVFLNWTRLNPQAAVAALAGTSLDYVAWWAWGANDPAAALAASIAGGNVRINNVAFGIGMFHADWVREHLDEIPESDRSTAIALMGRWHDETDPAGILDFSLSNGGRFDEKIFRSLINQDPWAAYEWAQKNGKAAGQRYGNGNNPAMDALLGEIAVSQPEMLQRLAEQAPPGQDKRKMDKLLFDQLLKTDPDAALAQATATKSPRVGAERFSSIGLTLAQSDPEQAFDMLGKALAIYPDALAGRISIQTPGGGSSSGSPPAGTAELVAALLAKDPARLLAMQSTTPDPMTGQSNLAVVAQTWASADLPAMEEWTKQQSDPALKSQLSLTVISRLQDEENYDNAAEWAAGLEQNRSASLNNILQNWANRDPDACAKWMESATLTEDERANFQRSQLNRHR